MARRDHDDLISKHESIFNEWMYNNMPSNRPTKKPPSRKTATLLAQPATAAVFHHDEEFDDDTLFEMLESRMRWSTSTTRECPFKTVTTTKVNDETVAVFVVTKDDALIIKDDLNLYPSDALVTQLQLLAGK